MISNTITATRVLRDVLSRNPKASLHEIRNAHPVFRAMSPDHLGLRLSRALEDAADPRAK